MFLLHFMYYMRDLDGYTLCQLSWNISYKMEKEFSMAGELPDLNQYQNTKLKTHFC